MGDGQRYAGGVWAPCLRYHAHKFYVYWPTPGEGIFVSTAARIAGPWSAPVALLSGPGYEDPCPFWDVDGKAYLIHARVGAGSLILHRLSPDGLRVLDAGTTIVEDRVNLPVIEGPKLYGRDGWYYIFAPIGGVGSGGQAVLRAHDLFGPYEWRVVLVPGGRRVHGTAPGRVRRDTGPEGDGSSTSTVPERSAALPIWSRSAGTRTGPSSVSPSAMAAQGQPVGEHAVPVGSTPEAPATTACRIADEFNSPTLGVQWEWNHNPDARLWSLEERAGFLRLHAAPAQYLVTARNTLTQVLQGPAMTVTARLEIGHLGDQQRAGLVLFGVKPTWIGVVRDAGVTYLTYASAGIETRGPSCDGCAARS